jgi:crossover junction endodeoxyribonuclease RuvC
LKELILGLDPGSRRTGYGIIAVQQDRISHVAHGVISLGENEPLHLRLTKLYSELHQLLSGFSIGTMAIEKIFYGKNVDSAFKLGHARGVCLLVAAQKGAAVAEYAARYVKKCITGSGAADKSHVQIMILRHLQMRERDLAFDASDALSLAVTHAWVGETRAVVKRALEETL